MEEPDCDLNDRQISVMSMCERVSYIHVDFGLSFVDSLPVGATQVIAGALTGIIQVRRSSCSISRSVAGAFMVHSLVHVWGDHLSSSLSG